jgi:hypothetical protein
VDLGNIVYIVAILGYFIYQATRNKKKNLEEGDNQQLPAEPEQRHSSFDDLLREIRDAQKPKQVQQPKPSQVKPPVIQLDRPEMRPDPVAQKRFPTKRRMEILDEDEIEYYKGEFDKVESELSTTSKGIPDIPSLKSIEQKISQKSGNRYNRMLHNRESIRDAVVLKEILDRKHF